MREIELKARCGAGERERLAACLTAAGFLPDGERRQEDEYYNHPARDFFATDEALRLRRTDGGSGACLTYKGRNLSALGQSREELECAVAQAETLRAILERLGFGLAARVCKTRTVYRRGKVTACLDEVEGLGAFLELEILCEPGAEREAAARRRLSALLGDLSLARAELEPKTYLELLLERSCANHG